MEIAARLRIESRGRFVEHQERRPVDAGERQREALPLSAGQRAKRPIGLFREGEAIGYELVPAGVAAADRRVYLDIHGGALIMGAGEVCQAMALNMATRLGARVVTVDYRMPPDHPFPAGLDDCLAFYRRLLRDHSPAEIIVGGGSAGGNLAAATVLRARDEGLPLPAAVVLVSPDGAVWVIGRSTT